MSWWCPQKNVSTASKVSRAPLLKLTDRFNLKVRKTEGEIASKPIIIAAVYIFMAQFFLDPFFSFSLQPNDFNFFYFQLLISPPPPSFYFCSFFFAVSANIDSSLNVIRNWSLTSVFVPSFFIDWPCIYLALVVKNKQTKKKKTELSPVSLAIVDT